MKSQLSLSSEIKQAIAEDRPVVALESTLISHGLPWPKNLETAIACENLIRESGSVPATVAIIDGQIRVGLSEIELEMLSKPGDRMIAKASRRDIAVITKQGGNAATTVSATMYLARSAGIHFMATGGLGGVHRGASVTFDISLDLNELARSDQIALICSGVKSILDIPATLETLETLGVTVIGYRTDEFPAFTEVSSGIRLEHQVNSPVEAAEVFQSHCQLGIPGAVVFAQACPEELAIDSKLAETSLIKALENAEKNGIKGKAVTPYLLSAIRELTQGQSLVVNTELIKKNAATSGQVAAAFHKLHRDNCY